MGAQIAALLAAAGVRVHLLDLASEQPPQDPKLAKAIGKNFRSTAAYAAIETLKALKPSPLTSPKVLANIIPGNFTDDMQILASVDWVIEAVVERLDIKKKMMKDIVANARQGIPITTNTSGLSLASIVEGEPAHITSRFFGTHFFNPPRYMKLVEIVTHGANDMTMVKEVANWIAERLGKGIVYTADTINFIANRIGVFNIQVSMKHMEDLGLSIETVDALTGKLMGRPSSATFRTMDVVGLDTFAHVAKNVYDYAPKDPYRDLFLPPKWIQELIENKALGKKTNDVGCYKKSKNAKGETEILVYRPKAKTYEQQTPQDFPWVAAASKEANIYKRFQTIFANNDAGAEYIWRTLRDTMNYSALLLEEIAHDEPLALDQAIQWGFNWEVGPFALWQGIGYDALLQRMQKENVKLPSWCKPGLQFYKPSPESVEWQATGPTAQLLPSAAKTRPIPRGAEQFNLPKFENPKDPRVVLSNKSASVLDLGDGIACLTFHSKMNAIDNNIIEMTQKAIACVDTQFAALVIANEGEAFSAGANLKQILEAIDKKDFTSIENLLRNFQGTMQLLKYAPFPSISCPHSLTLGGGCEVSLHTTQQMLTMETYAGLVEIGVGLIPAGGGTKELALRAYEQMELGERVDPMAYLQRAFLLIGMARTSASGPEAIEMGLYPRHAAYSLSRDHQVLRAKMLALELVQRGYAPPTPKTAIPVIGDPGIQTFKMMLYNMVEGRQISAYDAVIAEHVATVLCGGAIDPGQTVSESYLLDLERQAFLALCHESKTRDRIEHMLKSGKPLRN